jgi:hypothetical protein
MTEMRVPHFLQSSHTYKNFHLVMLLVWTVMFPVAFLTGLKTALGFITFISLYANWATHFGAWQGSRAEVKVDEQGTVAVDNVDVEVEKRTP